MSARWTREDFAAPADALAPRLLGQRLVSVVRGKRRAGVIVETEAYLGPEDLASHAAGGRRTARTEPMWGAPGLAYIYISYGLHRCMNVVAGTTEDAHAVLIRALAPTEGLPQMRRVRNANRRKTALSDRDLASGPGKLCQALGITESRSGDDLTTSGNLWIERAAPPKDAEIVQTPRIGLGPCDEWSLRPLRYVIARHPFASRPTE